jgi:type VI secretion system protein ImpL
MQRLLGNYFADGQGNLRWLVTWADRQLEGKSVTLAGFWNPPNDTTSQVRVPAAFTLEGKRLIGNFVTGELAPALEQPVSIAKPRERFAAWYRDAYYAAWMNFCRNFGQGKTLFTTDAQWNAAVSRLTGEQSPYLGLLDRLGKELFPGAGSRWPSLKLASDDKRCDWLTHIRNFNIIRQAAASAAAGDAVTGNPEAQGALSRLSMKTRLLARVAKGVMDKSQMGEGKKAYSQYIKTLKGFDGICDSCSGAYEIAKAGFQDRGIGGKSVVSAAYRAVDQLRTVLDKNASFQDEEAGKDPFWCLVTGPVDDLWAYTVRQASRQLQQLWDQKVVVTSEGIYERNRMDELLFGSNGKVPRFVETYADPFMAQTSRRGYFARKCRGCSVSFKTRFFRYIGRGQRWRDVTGTHGQNYRVDITALPTNVNTGAKVKPDMTRLSLEHPNGATVLVNRQYPLENTFTWSPSEGGDVSLKIYLGDVVLTKKYTGRYAFARFLRDFSMGKRDFTVSDFPENRADFQRFGVTKIEVIYQLQERQIRPIIQLMRTAPGSPPARIISSY